MRLDRKAFNRGVSDVLSWGTYWPLVLIAVPVLLLVFGSWLIGALLSLTLGQVLIVALAFGAGVLVGRHGR